ncbi:MAG: gamma-glutamyl-gamma-aminobutyrate hydrolase family protein [Ilumatobacteraceae bacterium]
MRAMLIANAADADAGFVGERLRELGYVFTACQREHPESWPPLDGHDLVLMLGSEWSVYWSDVRPAVLAESAVVRGAVAAGVPMIGICFGSQLVAHALGGSVSRAATPEIGWYEVDSDVPQAIACGPWMQWHADVVVIPPAATELARSMAGPQAWQIGRGLCTQFHPEATEAVVARWAALGAKTLAEIGTSPDELMAATRANVAVSAANAVRLVDWFCEHVAR